MSHFTDIRDILDYIRHPYMVDHDGDTMFLCVPFEGETNGAAFKFDGRENLVGFESIDGEGVVGD